MGWPAPRVAAGPVRIIKADVVGNGHVRAIVSGDDGGSLKAVAFRQAETALGQALLGAPPHRRLWLAGRVKIDDWGARPACELPRSEARRCGTECVSTCRSRWCPYHEKKNTKEN